MLIYGHISAIMLTSAHHFAISSFQGKKLLAKITVLLADDEFERFEAFCEQKGHKKSTLIARLIREHLDREGFKNQLEIFRPDMEKAKHK